MTRWIAAAAALVVLASCGRSVGDARPVAARSDAIVIGAFNFSESELLAEIYRLALEANGFDAEVLGSVASREIMEPALEQAQVDVVVEYLGTALTFLDPDAAAALHSVRKERRALTNVLASRGIDVLAEAPGQNRNEIVVTRAVADEYDLEKISDLAAVADDFTFGGPPECPGRPLCLKGLEDTYGLAFAAFQPLDSGGPQTIAALEGGEVDVALLFTTNPRIATDDLVVLDDDRDLQPAENVIPVVRHALAVKEGPALAEAIDEVTRLLTDHTLRDLNKQAEIEGRDRSDVAKSWLQEEGLV